MTLHYNALNAELRSKIINKELSEEELDNVKYTLDTSLHLFKKPKKKANIFGLISIISIVLIILTFVLFIGDNPIINIENGSDAAKNIVYVLLGFFGAFIVSILITAFFSLKYLGYVYLNELFKLMKKHYPESLKEWNYIA